MEWNVEWLEHNTVVRVANPLLKCAIGCHLGPKRHSIRSRRLGFTGYCIKAFTPLSQKSVRSDAEREIMRAKHFHATDTCQTLAY